MAFSAFAQQTSGRPPRWGGAPLYSPESLADGFGHGFALKKMLASPG